MYKFWVHKYYNPETTEDSISKTTVSVFRLKVYSYFWDNFWQPKALFLSYLNFCLDFLAIYQNGLIKKIWLISNFMTSQPGQQTNVIRILPNISKNKGNQTMKFGQLIQKCYIGPNIKSLVNRHKMWWRNYFQTLFWKIKIENISGLTA